MDVFFSESNFINNKKNVIIECDSRGILQCMCYSEMNKISELLKDVLNLQENCVGLLMVHNIYLPSIILSLYRMKCPFVFLKPKSTDRLISHINLNYILSFSDDLSINLFNKSIEIKVNNFISLFLWERVAKVTEEDIKKSDLFCVVESTGTTGINKIIKVPVKCILNNSMSLSKIFYISEADVIFWGTPLTFDPSLIEFLIAIENKCTLIIVPSRTYLNSNNLMKALFELKTEIYKGITFLQIVPSVFFRWTDNQIQKILESQLKVLAFGGEPFPKNILKFERTKYLKLFNLYGISELSCWATAKELTNEKFEDDISIGDSIGDTIVNVKNENGDVVENGTGEIYIGSNKRYCIINNEGINSIKVVFRKTGDLARINEKGIFYVGRTNNIIKRFGHRVNLSKIEAIIFKETYLTNKCIFLEKQQKLVTFIHVEKLVNEMVTQKTIDKIRVKLLKVLSRELFPDSIKLIEKFPLNKHGKVDLKSLEDIFLNSLKDFTPKNSYDILLNLFSKFLGLAASNIDEYKTYSFFELGGNSIIAVQVLNEIQEYFNDEDKEKLVSLLFESSLEENLNYVKTVKTLKRKGGDVLNEVIEEKRKKTDIELKISWTYDLKACVDSIPLVFEYNKKRYIAVGGFSNIFVILDSNGKEFYKITLDDTIEGAPNFSYKHNLLYTGCFDGKMYCMDVKEKNIKWTYKTDDRIKSRPCFCLNEEAAVFGSYDKSVYCVSLLDGELIWKANLSESISSNPVYNESKKIIYLTSITGTCFSLKEEDGRIIWKCGLKSPIFGAVCLLDSGKLLVPTVDGIVHSLSEGKCLSTYKANGNIYSSLISYKTSLFFGCHDGYLYNLKLSADSCELLFKINLGSPITSSPCVFQHQDKDFIAVSSNKGTVHVIDMVSGNSVSDLTLAGDIFSSPVVIDKKIYIGCRDNNFYCLDLLFNN